MVVRPSLFCRWRVLNSIALLTGLRCSVAMLVKNLRPGRHCDSAANSEIFNTVVNDVTMFRDLVTALAICYFCGTVLGGSPERLWALDTGALITSRLSARHDGSLVLGTDLGAIHAISPSGRVIWETSILPNRPVQRKYIRSSPVSTADGAVYAGMSTSIAGDAPDELIALDQDGAIQWRLSLPGSIVATPALASNGTIYIGEFSPGAGQHLYAIDSAGKVLWRYRAGGPIFGSPVVGNDGTIYFGTWANRFHAVNRDGIRKWQISTPQPVSSSPAIDTEGNIYFGLSGAAGDSRRFFSVTPGGDVRWTLNSAQRIGASPVIGPDGVVYVAGEDRLMRALYRTGEIKWSRLLEGTAYAVSSATLAADGTVYVGVGESASSRGRFYALESANGAIRWEFETAMDMSQTPLLGSDGTLFLVEGRSVVAYATKSPFAESAWPTFQGNAQRWGRAHPVPPEPPRITDVRVEVGSGDGRTVLRLGFAPSSIRVILEGSEDLRNWEIIRTYGAGEATASLEVGPLHRRYFRLRIE